MDEYLPRVYRYALRLTGNRQQAEDLAQETFLKAWRRRRQLRDPKAAPVWLLTIARNLWKDWLRRQMRRPVRVEPLEEEPPGNARQPDHDSMAREELRRVLEALETLPARQREVVYLFACEGLSLAEIAQVLGVTVEAAKASLCEARKRLRRRFREIDCTLSPSEREMP